MAMKTTGNFTESGSSTAEVFGRLYERHLQGVFQYIYYRVGNRVTAEDLTSDVFSKALAAFSRYNPEKAAFLTWIFSIARNTIIDYYRRRGKEMQLLKEETESRTLVSPQSPEDEASRTEETQKLYQCLAKLRPNEQELISLKFGGEMTNREIAGITGLSESNVGTILCRTMRKLRDYLEQ